MKYLILLSVVFASVLVCQVCKAKDGGKPVEKITALETKGLLVNGFAVLVDVREDDEVKDGMAADAQWMPLSKIEANSPEWAAFQKKLPKDKKIVLYCAAGGRAGKVAKMLTEKGYQTANMGGFSSWEAAGLPVKKP